MEKKYELTNEKYEITDEMIKYQGHSLYRIKALKDFSNAHVGDLGGFIESEKNLSQSDDCWVYDNAYIYDDAKIYGNARVRGNARIFDEAEVYENALISENVAIFGKAKIHDNANIFGNTVISDKAEIFGNAEISGNAEVYGYAKICGHARIIENAQVFKNAVIFGHALIAGWAQVAGCAKVSGNAKVLENASVFDNGVLKYNERISSGVVYTDISKNLVESIRVQTGLIPANGKVIAYKQVNDDLTSLYDHRFKYEVGQVAYVINPEISNRSCASGLHFSNANYWNQSCNIRSTTFLIAEINLEDIITVQDGKIRCQKAFILDSYKIKDEREYEDGNENEKEV